ncbi:MAG: glutamate racemase [Candidatus Kapabacteria bacterium]|nr:glutamate racemase [Candidatus Kapabacteria bacterium]
MSTDPRPIGVFDSGIGGLSVLKHLVRLLPHERFVYLGDTARVPYGNKSPDTVRQYSLQCASFLQKHDVKMIVVACNTASALALDALRSALSIPVIGVIEPAAREASQRTRNGHIGVIGTRATIASDSYARTIESYASGRSLSVHSRPCPLFVPRSQKSISVLSLRTELTLSFWVARTIHSWYRFFPRCCQMLT